MYEKMFEDVKKILAENDGATKNTPLPFRSRSEHIWRVFNWAKRLLDNGGPVNFVDNGRTADVVDNGRTADVVDNNDLTVVVDREAVLIAALFHDVGYALPLEDANHADSGVVIFNKYADENNIDPEKAKFIAYLIQNHSNKSLFNCDDTPQELILLMEADLLDETGAMSIVWDCMSEGVRPDPAYVKAYRHIEEYSYKTFDNNPMKTAKARAFWEAKQELMKAFISHLAFDLAIDGNCL